MYPNKPISEVDIVKPKDSDDENLSVGRTVRTWAENASCNGVPNIERSRHPARFITWFLLVLIGTGMSLGYHCEHM